MLCLKIVKLPSGNTATLRDPATLKVKDRKKHLPLQIIKKVFCKHFQSLMA
jgi:hypothetical protein